MSEPLSTFLLMLATCLLVAGLRRGHGGWYLAGGLAGGLAALGRPQAQALLVLVPLVALLCPRRWRPVVRSTALLFAGAALVLLPWMVRNQVTHGSFTISGGTGQQLAFRTMSHGSFRFLDRDNPPSDRARFRAREELQDAAETVERDENKPVTSIVKINAWLERELGLSEAAVDGLLREAALEAILDRPSVYARLVLTDTWRNLVGSEDDFAGHWRGRPPGNSRLNDLAVRLAPRRSDGFALAERLVSLYESARFGPVLAALFGVGLVAVAGRPAWRPGLLLALLALTCQAASAALAFHLTRYQYLTEPLVHVVAFGGLVALGEAALRWIWRPAEPARESTAELRPT